jgi:hypothetical protein
MVLCILLLFEDGSWKVALNDAIFSRYYPVNHQLFEAG